MKPKHYKQLFLFLLFLASVLSRKLTTNKEEFSTGFLYLYFIFSALLYTQFKNNKDKIYFFIGLLLYLISYLDFTNVFSNPHIPLFLLVLAGMLLHFWIFYKNKEDWVKFFFIFLNLMSIFASFGKVKHQSTCKNWK